MTGMLRTKWGMALLVLLVTGVFFTLSKLKQRNARRAAPQAAVAAAPGQPGAEDAALLKRAQETARAKAEDVRSVRAVDRRTTRTSDETGNVYRRQSAPSPVEGILPAGDRERGEQAATSGSRAVQPSLRIRGRKREGEESGGAVGKSLEKWLPALPSLPALPDLGTFPGGPPGKGGDGTAPGSRSSRPAPPQRFIPFGRLIKAELVMTLESSMDEMPLVGLITDPVYNNGRLVIPAGTEIHSTARPSRLRDRILSGSEWRMIFPREGLKPNGRQLTFSGVALDREDQDANGLTWPLTDGSFGLRGRIIRKGQTEEEVMIFAAEALKAAGAALMEREATVAGSRLEANAKNAALSGGQAVLARLTENILKELEVNGAYVQVPAGKQFYIYPRQVIDPDRADVPENVAAVE